MNPSALTPPDDSPEARERALEAVRELLRWIGEDPEREGLAETPRRVIRQFSFTPRGVQSPRAYFAGTPRQRRGF